MWQGALPAEGDDESECPACCTSGWRDTRQTGVRRQQRRSWRLVGLLPPRRPFSVLTLFIALDLSPTMNMTTCILTSKTSALLHADASKPLSSVKTLILHQAIIIRRAGPGKWGAEAKLWWAREAVMGLLGMGESLPFTANLGRSSIHSPTLPLPSNGDLRNHHQRDCLSSTHGITMEWASPRGDGGGNEMLGREECPK